MVRISSTFFIKERWQVRIVDNLEPQTHRNGQPGWLPDSAEFIHGSIQDRATIKAALQRTSTWSFFNAAFRAFRQAVYAGYMPEIAKYVHVNSFGTAQMLEVIRDEKLPIQKVVVASSQAVYSEGAATCPEHGLVFPGVRPTEQLRAGDYPVHCPKCGAQTTSVPTPEGAPIGGETVYGLTKVDQERLVLNSYSSGAGRQGSPPSPYDTLAPTARGNLFSIRTQA